MERKRHLNFSRTLFKSSLHFKLVARPLGTLADGLAHPDSRARMAQPDTVRGA